MSRSQNKTRSHEYGKGPCRERGDDMDGTEIRDCGSDSNQNALHLCKNCPRTNVNNYKGTRGIYAILIIFATSLPLQRDLEAAEFQR